MDWCLLSEGGKSPYLPHFNVLLCIEHHHVYEHYKYSLHVYEVGRTAIQETHATAVVEAPQRHLRGETSPFSPHASLQRPFLNHQLHVPRCCACARDTRTISVLVRPLPGSLRSWRLREETRSVLRHEFGFWRQSYDRRRWSKIVRRVCCRRPMTFRGAG